MTTAPAPVPIFTPAEALAIGWAPIDRAPAVEISAFVCLMLFPRLRSAIRAMPVPVSLLFSDPILASRAEAIVEDAEWVPEPGTDPDAIERRWFEVDDFIAVLADRAERGASVWTEEDGRNFLRTLMRDAGSPLVATTLRLAANAIERGESLRQAQRDVNRAFDLARGAIAPELDAA